MSCTLNTGLKHKSTLTLTHTIHAVIPVSFLLLRTEYIFTKWSSPTSSKWPCVCAYDVRVLCYGRLTKQTNNNFSMQPYSVISWAINVINEMNYVRGADFFGRDCVSPLSPTPDIHCVFAVSTIIFSFCSKCLCNCSIFVLDDAAAAAVVVASSLPSLAVEPGTMSWFFQSFYWSHIVCRVESSMCKVCALCVNMCNVQAHVQMLWEAICT